jgi:hypothetical protein
MPQPLVICDYQSIVQRNGTDTLFDLLLSFRNNGAEIYFGTYANDAEHAGQRQFMELHYPGFIKTVLDHRAADGFITRHVVGAYKYADRFWPALCDKLMINASDIIFMDNDPIALDDAKKMGVRTVDTGTDYRSFEKPLDHLKKLYAAIARKPEPSGQLGNPIDARPSGGRISQNILMGPIGPKPN